MGTFDSFADSPFQIRTEGQDITIIFARTGETTGRISWNIPTPAFGCSADEQAYNGIIVTVDSTATAQPKQPTDGVVYTADPTADPDLHAGDKIDTSLVVGAFYNDKVTTFVDITGLTDAPVFVSGFAVDPENRYHTNGVHAYALDYRQDNEVSPKAGYQNITLGVAGTDPTNLVIGTDYDFSLDVDGTEYDLVINGTNASTYNDLVDAITVALSTVANPVEDVTPPNTGDYYWNTSTQKLFQWDGYQHVEQTAFVEPVEPNTPVTGDYWYNPTTELLTKWNGSAWVSQLYVNYIKDPTSLSGSDYWYNGTNSYVWDGTTWCENTLSIQATDPSAAVDPEFGTYWYDTVNLFLYKWNDQTSAWVAVDAIYWGVNPNTLAINTYWFDETNNVLNQWSGSIWNAITTTISSTEPATPGPNSYWYNPDLEELKQRNPTNTAWIDLTVLVFADDPTDRASCNLWWDSVNDLLYVWDITTAAWDNITNFLQQAIDPAAAPTMTTDNTWYNTTDETLSRWDGSMWVSVTFIDFATDPTIAVLGSVWFDSVNSIWYERIGSPLGWSAFNPADSTTDPSIPAVGAFWFDTTNTLLYQWVGSPGVWTSTTFTTVPLTPTTGSLWFDTTVSILKEWDGTTWVASTLVAVPTLTSGGDLRITSSTTGSGSYVLVVEGEGWLFGWTTPLGNAEEAVLGTDGIVPEPSYSQIGIGDDGTPDQRRELMDSIRQQLGYPVVDVELTKYQLDTAVTAALESLRKRSAAAYHRAFFFVDIPPGEQNLLLTNKTVGFNRIVNVMGAYRVTSSFLSTAFGSGVYGQIALQHLYTMGTFDLLSFHLVSQYIETMEMLFASRLTFMWNEHTRQLSFFQTFGAGRNSTDTGSGASGIPAERVLLDCTLERSEQELMTDRWTKSWIERYASAEARMMLAEIRGKYASLPGAGGGVALNAGELRAIADADKAECYQQLDDFIVNDVENYGIGTTFVIG